MSAKGNNRGNKRKSGSQPRLDDTNKPARPIYQSSGQGSLSRPNPEQFKLSGSGTQLPMADSGWPKGDFGDVDWDDLTRRQLAEFCFKNLDMILKSAIKKIAAYGYTEDDFLKAVTTLLRDGLCYGCKDTESNIVENTLAFLRSGQGIDSVRGHLFENLQQVVKYILAEMVHVLKEVRPLSTGDAMWCLLISDMNVPGACAIEGGPCNVLSSSDGSKASSSVYVVPKRMLKALSSEDTVSNVNKPNLPTRSNPTAIEALAPEIKNPLFDKTTGRWVPRDKQEEMIMQLAIRVGHLRKQTQKWTEWGNHKVMEAAHRLGEDKAELKSLRQEKEATTRFQKDRKALEDNAIKKLSEMQKALYEVTAQVGRTTAAVRMLEVENAERRQRMEEAKVQDTEAAANCKEALEKKEEGIKKCQLAEKQNAALQEELAKLRHLKIQLEQEVEQAQVRLNQFEARRKQEEEAKEALLMQAESLRRERENFEAAAKFEEEEILLKAADDLKKYKDDTRDLETQIAQITVKTNTSKTAPPQWNASGSRGPSIKGTQQDPGMKTNNSGNENVKRERECVMCLAEERSVVFLPCAHQVLCPECNERHKKHGMKECPSCRTFIQRRICARFVCP